MILLAGCSPHYALTDPESGQVYLTRSLDDGPDGVTFKDRVTRSRVTLASPEITRIGDDEYNALLDHLRTKDDTPWP